MKNKKEKSFDFYCHHLQLLVTTDFENLTLLNRDEGGVDCRLGQTGDGREVLGGEEKGRTEAMV